MNCPDLLLEFFFLIQLQEQLVKNCEEIVCCCGLESVRRAFKILGKFRFSQVYFIFIIKVFWITCILSSKNLISMRIIPRSSFYIAQTLICFVDQLKHFCCVPFNIFIWMEFQTLFSKRFCNFFFGCCLFNCEQFVITFFSESFLIIFILLRLCSTSHFCFHTTF